MHMALLLMLSTLYLLVDTRQDTEGSSSNGWHSVLQEHMMMSLLPPCSTIKTTSSCALVSCQPFVSRIFVFTTWSTNRALTCIEEHASSVKVPSSKHFSQSWMNFRTQQLRFTWSPVWHNTVTPTTLTHQCLLFAIAVVVLCPVVHATWWEISGGLIWISCHRHFYHLECEMSNEIAEHTIKILCVMEVQNGSLIPMVTIFVWKRELCSFKDRN